MTQPSPADELRAARASAILTAADRIALDLTPTGNAPLGYRHAITDVVRLLRKLGDEEATR
ncbi:hypothetical protein ACI2LJ_27680 [Streptomyces sp. NPDC088090]|uniref:hypothetical protein n=1 Tax=Streptomyces sp. NPDC088090 TaxID=3365822 RepID=UPI003850632E